MRSAVRRLEMWGASLLMCLWLLACAPPPAIAPTQPSPTETATATPTATAEPPRLATLQPAPPAEGAIMDSLDATGKQLVAQARQDLAGRLKVDTPAATLVSAEATRWSDSSLGCPQPGMMYAQVITPGYRFVFRVAGQPYEYHTDYKRVVLCEAKP